MTIAMEIVILAIEIESNGAMEQWRKIIATTNSGSVRFVDCWLVASSRTANGLWILASYALAVKN